MTVSEAGSNGINIDYFKLDFNRYAWTGIFKPGLNFGPILFIMINQSPLPIPLSTERGGGSVVSVPRDREALWRIKRQLKRKAGDEAERVFLIEASKKNKGNISKTALDVKMGLRHLQNLIRRHGIFVKESMASVSSAQ